MLNQIGASIDRNQISEVYLTAVNAVCADIGAMYSLDCKTKILTVVRKSPNAKDINDISLSTCSYEDAVKTYVMNNVLVQDREPLLRSMRFENVYGALQKEGRFSVPYHVYRDGILKNYRLKCYRVGDSDEIERIIFTFSPEDFITSQSATIKSLEMDETTGVYSKQAFYQYAERLLGEHKDEPFDLIIVDVDNFKLMNQVYGRSDGDKVLRKE